VNRVDDELIGATLGDCVIEELLGQGGMARVYRAKQANLERDVAVKVLPPYYAADEAFVERFKLEARAMARLSHPNIVAVYFAGEENGRLFITMEYVGGGNLKQRMLAKMPLRDIVRIVNEIAGALTYAHSMGIVHRDVKPVNVLMDLGGRAVLSDFGIAKVLATSAALTRDGAGVGTPEYMSPEQCRGVGVDYRSDIYALGVMLYEMLTGRTPFIADNYTALAHSHIYEPAPPPSQLNPHISPAVQAVILKALEKNPAERFQKATELAIALEQAVAAQAPMPSAAVGRQTAAPTPGAQPLPTGAPRRSVPSAPLGALVCPRCHHPNAPHQNFCSACGLALRPLQPAPPASQGPYQQHTASWVRCPACGAPNAQGNRFCTNCRQPLAIICPICGARNAPTQRFCATCRRQLQ
jgi:serine/threonine-protein kinase